MTMLSKKEVICAICGGTNDHPVIATINLYGEGDLDFRPSELFRYTMHLWLKECPHCGYVSKNLSVASTGVSEVVNSDAYKKNQFSFIPDSFLGLCHAAAFIEEKLNEPKYTARFLLWAAWDADDRKDFEAAKLYRHQVADLLRPFLPDMNGLSEEDQVFTLKFIDILRRGRRFTEALELASAIANLDDVSPRHQIIARFQETLAKNRDYGCYTIEEAIGLERPPGLYEEDLSDEDELLDIPAFINPKTVSKLPFFRWFVSGK